MKTRETRTRATVTAARWMGIVLLLGLAPVSGCSSEGPAPVPPAPAPLPYEPLFTNVLDYLLAWVPVLPDGNVIGDFGDSTGYAPATLFPLAHETHDTSMGSLAARIADRETLLIRGSILEIVANIMDVYIGTIGSFRAYEYTGEPVDQETAEEVLDLFNDVFDLIPDRIFFRIEPIPYGPTTIIGGVALYNLQYAFSIGDTPATPDYRQQGLDLIRRIDAEAWDEERGFYLYSKDNEICSAYPNSIMIIALCRAYQLTGETRYLDRARAVAEAVERILLDSVTGGYYGAQPNAEGYMALSNNNYITQALLFLAEIDGDPVYLRRADRTLTFIQDSLCEPAHGICYHDLRLYHRTDWFCSGCNWQLIYNILEYRRLTGG